jgi:hypothetical protein
MSRFGAMSTPVTVIVVTWQGRDLLPGCLDSLRRQTRAHRLLVVDNASTDGTAQLLADDYPEAEVLPLPRNTGFAGGVQAGMARVDTPYVALLNNDAQAEPGWLAALVDTLDGDETLAAVTSRMLLVEPAGVINNAGVGLRPDGYGYDLGLGEPDGPDFDQPREVFGFSGGAAALRTDVARDLGGFAERFFLYYEDTDLAWRLRLAGHRVGYEPRAVVRHQHSASADQNSVGFAFHNERNRLLMLTRCAPASLAATQLARFPVTTASLALKRLAGRPLPPGHHFRTSVRISVLRSYLTLLPWALRTRRQIGRTVRIPRTNVVADWLGPAVKTGQSTML